MKFNKAKTKLLSGFLDTYLRLSAKDISSRTGEVLQRRKGVDYGETLGYKKGLRVASSKKLVLKLLDRRVAQRE